MSSVNRSTADICWQVSVHAVGGAIQPGGSYRSEKAPCFLTLSAGFSLTRGYRNPAGLVPRRGEIQAVSPQERDEPSLVGEKPEPPTAKRELPCPRSCSPRHPRSDFPPGAHGRRSLF